MKPFSDFIAGLFCILVFAAVATVYIGIPILAIYAVCHFIAKFW